MALETWEIHTMNDYLTMETEWLWYPYIPLGKVTIIQGDPGEGKTTLALNIAAALSNGRILGSEETCEPANIIYQTAEDGIADTIKPRLIAAGADLSRIYNIDERTEQLSFTSENLEAGIQQIQPKLVILDPLQAYLGSKVDMHRANEVRPAMSRLATLAYNYQCAIVLIGHMNKNMGTKSAYRGLGSIDITAAARSVLIVARDKMNKQTRVVAHIKSSLAPEGDTVAFRLGEDNKFEYIGKYKADIDALLLGASTPTVKDSAKELIETMLKDGERPALEIYEAASKKGISPTTLRKAKLELGVNDKRKNQAFYWSL